MPPALAAWRPEDILVVRKIRQVRADELDCFDPPRAPRILTRPTHELCHHDFWQDRAWIDATDRTR